MRIEEIIGWQIMYECKGVAAMEKFQSKATSPAKKDELNFSALS